MAEALLDMAISLDGLICGPGGADGGLYDWYFNPSDLSRPVVEELVATTGAIVIGRGAFGTGDAGGWDDTPYEVPHFVVTHRPPQPELSGTVEFVFVPAGVQSAVTRPREGRRPVLLGDGIRLFDRPARGWSLTKRRVVDAPNLTHLRYHVDRP